MNADCIHASWRQMAQHRKALCGPKRVSQVPAPKGVPICMYEKLTCFFLVLIILVGIAVYWVWVRLVWPLEIEICILDCAVIGS